MSFRNLTDAYEQLACDQRDLITLEHALEVDGEMGFRTYTVAEYTRERAQLVASIAAAQQYIRSINPSAKFLRPMPV
jgi:hypothetical protein